MHTIRTFASSLLVLGIVLAPATGRANAVYTAVYAFGDSLSDAGNVSLATGGAQPAPPYVNGQYANGPTWVQSLSAGLGLGPLTPSLLGGTDFAWGGATTGNATTAFNDVPNLAQQVGLFAMSLGANPAQASALYTVWIGANDVFSLLDGTATCAPADAVQCTMDAAQAQAAAMAQLAALGATNFLVPLLPDLGNTPLLRAAGPATQAAGSALSATYNAALLADLAGLAGQPGIDLVILDTFSLLDQVIANPGAAGLSNVSDACYLGAETGGGSVCAQPDQYLFWDAVHPTAATQGLIAAAALAELPEPGTLAMVVTALLGLVVSRRRAHEVA